MEDEDVKPFTQAGPSRRRGKAPQRAQHGMGVSGGRKACSHALPAAPEIHVEREELMVFLHALMRVGMVSLIKAQVCGASRSP